MKVTATTNYGGASGASGDKVQRDGFNLVLKAEVNDAQLAKLAEIGLASVAYRGGASVLCDALGVDSNSQAEFSEENAQTISTTLTEWAAGEKSPIETPFALAVEVSRREIGAAAEPGKMASALWEQTKAQDLFALIGAKGDETDEEGIAVAKKFLAGLKGKKN